MSDSGAHFDVALCIYCEGPGPFTGEHVVPAGAGGDDKRWVLHDCVCEQCNTGIFSPLEAKFLRSSPVAIARIYMQERSRNRGKRTRAPVFDTDRNFAHDPQTKIDLQAEIQSGFKTTIMPQIIVKKDGTILISGSSRASVSKFLKCLERTLTGAPRLITKKQRTADGNVFTVYDLLWSVRDTYALSHQTEERVPPENAIWYEGQEDQGKADDDGIIGRIVHRSGGQIVCGAKNTDWAAAALGIVKTSSYNTVDVDSASMTQIDKPDVTLRMAIDIEGYYRVIAKIGFNLCAMLYGPHAMFRPEFRPTARFVHDGAEGLSMVPDDIWKSVLSLFLLKGDKHLLMLWPLPEEKSMKLLFSISMYGTNLGAFEIAHFDEFWRQFNCPRFFEVEYKSNKISEIAFADMLKI